MRTQTFLGVCRVNAWDRKSYDDKVYDSVEVESCLETPNFRRISELYPSRFRATSIARNWILGAAQINKYERDIPIDGSGAEYVV